MRLGIIGTVGVDTIETPYKKKSDVLGGSATYSSLSAVFFMPVRVITVLGYNFPRKYLKIFYKKNVEIIDVSDEKTGAFRWRAIYSDNLDAPPKSYVDKNIFDSFNISQINCGLRGCQSVLFANISPRLQRRLIRGLSMSHFICSDTALHWIRDGRGKEVLLSLEGVDVFFINEIEAKTLIQDDNLIKIGRKLFKYGPKVVVIKRGQNGVFLITKRFKLILPAFPLEKTVDPTGAGDTFAGVFSAILLRYHNRLNINILKKALVFSSVVASFVVENIGVKKLISVNKTDIISRYYAFKRMVDFF